MSPVVSAYCCVTCCWPTTSRTPVHFCVSCLVLTDVPVDSNFIVSHLLVCSYGWNSWANVRDRVLATVVLLPMPRRNISWHAILWAHFIMLMLKPTCPPYINVLCMHFSSDLMIAIIEYCRSCIADAYSWVMCIIDELIGLLKIHVNVSEAAISKCDRLCQTDHI